MKPFDGYRVGGTEITNEWNCPLLELQYRIEVLHSSSVLRAVSIVHQCTNTCTFNRRKALRTVERESIEQESLTYSHDVKNMMYCLNIYKMP